MSTEVTRLAAAEPRVVDVDEIRARAAAAAPGPWMWRGNVDHGDPELSRYEPGHGRVEVLRHYPRERTAQDKGARDYDQFLSETQWLDDQTREFRHLTDEERAEKLRTDWLEDPWGNTKTDTRMAFVDHTTYFALDARDLAVYEVCPEATERNDPRVYRADITGIRHPDAEFIAHSRQDVDDLVAIVDAVKSICDRHEAGAARWEHPLPVPEWVAELRTALAGVRMCHGCGCTDDAACAGGCAWRADMPNLCTSCPVPEPRHVADVAIAGDVL